MAFVRPRRSAAIVPSFLLALALIAPQLAADTVSAGPKPAAIAARAKARDKAVKQSRLRRAATGVSKFIVTKVGGGADGLGKILHKRSVKLTKKGKRPGLAKGLDRLGRTIVLLAGTETLRHTQFQVQGALVFTTPGLSKFANVSTHLGVFMPSLARLEKGVRGKELFEYGTGLETLVGGIGYDNFGGRWSGINAPYVAPWVGERAWGATLGLEYKASLGLGRYEKFGYYAGTTGSLPLFGLVELGWGATLYYPGLGPILEKVRPHAEKLQRAQNRVLQKLDRKTKPVRNRVKKMTAPARERAADMTRKTLERIRSKRAKTDP